MNTLNVTSTTAKVYLRLWNRDSGEIFNRVSELTEAYDGGNLDTVYKLVMANRGGNRFTYNISANLPDGNWGATPYALADDDIATANDVVIGEDIDFVSSGGQIVSSGGGGGAAGSGADTVTMNFVKEGSVPVEGASIWVSTDSAGSNVVAGSLTTDSAGDVDFLLDHGTVYYAFARRDGLDPIIGEAFTASVSGNDFTMTTATAPAGNYYCNPAAFAIYYDIRQMGMLSRDDNERAIFTATVQALLDAAADELNSHLAGRYAIPLATGGVTWDIATNTMPGPLTKWVAVKACERHYARRNDRPKNMDKEIEDVDGWLNRIISGESSLADKNGVQLGRGLIATLDSSDFTDGRSRFDGGLFPRASATSPSRGL